jgi:hypothetical protein
VEEPRLSIGLKDSLNRVFMLDSVCFGLYRHSERRSAIAHSATSELYSGGQPWTLSGIATPDSDRHSIS